MTGPVDDAAGRTTRILAVVRAIPSGAVLSYGEVALHAGLPGRARLVARVLASTMDPRLPWHRVVASGGRIALPEASEAGKTQRRRLVAEGHRIRGDRLIGGVAAPPTDLDVALWGPSTGPERPR
jgi:methylated-DNA-protein-cysteine methyltransferase-like protein